MVFSVNEYQAMTKTVVLARELYVNRLIWKSDEIESKSTGATEKLSFDFIPSSAFPEDVSESWNAVMRSDHLGFLAQRFKELFVKLLDKKNHGGQYDNIVIDTSPTLYGLSGEFIQIFKRKKKEESWNRDFEELRGRDAEKKLIPWDKTIWTPIVISTDDANDLSAFSKNLSRTYTEYLVDPENEIKSGPFINVYNKIKSSSGSLDRPREFRSIYDLITTKYLTEKDRNDLHSKKVHFDGSDITLLQYIFKERSVAIQENENRRKAYKNEGDLSLFLSEAVDDEGFKELFNMLEIDT